MKMVSYVLIPVNDNEIEKTGIYTAALNQMLNDVSYSTSLKISQEKIEGY